MDDDYDGRLSRFMEIGKRLEIAGVPYFTTTVTQSQMEIPASFVRDYGEQMKPTARLRLGSGSRVWPAQIQVCYSVRFRVRFCNRWRAFLSDNGLRKGDELIVSLVATSEFLIYMLKKKNLDPRYNSISTDTTSTVSSGDVLPRSKFRASPVNLGVSVEMQEGNSFRARPVGLDSDKIKKPMVAIERRSEIPDDSFNGAVFFRKRMSEASTGHFGHPQFARIEIPAEFARRHGRLLGEDTVIILEGPMPGSSSQVVCRHGPTNRRIMWRRGWPNFVTRNELTKGDHLEFTLTAPNRFSVRLTHKRTWSSTGDVSFTIRNVKKGSPAQGCKTPNVMPVESAHFTHRSAAVDLHKNPHFIKILPASSLSKTNAYPFLVIPTSFWHFVRLPLEVDLQGPNSDEVFPVKCSGDVEVGATKNLTCGWRDYANSNALKIGDKLRFTYVSESKLVLVDYV